jgi:hypothetical protein
MPSSSKKQHNFMAAIANNPSFAKKVGVSQSVGKDFNEADKGRKFGKGGATQQRINKQDTKHGKLDLPVANLNRMAGMKGGGSVKKVLRFNGADDSDVRTPEGEFKMAGLGSRTIAQTNATEPGSRVDSPKSKGSADFNQRFRKEMKRFKDEGGDNTFEYDGKKIALEYKKPKAASAAPTKEQPERFARAITGITAYDKARAAKAATQAMRKDSDTPTPTLTSGSSMKDEMGMKKGGMPMKDGKPAFMKKFAKGGGIESKGKTKGTIIKMAAGGSVGSASRRADGIAQRGKTKLKNY